MQYTIKGIPGNMIGELWRFAEPFVKRALDHTFGELSADDIKLLCENREQQLWMVVDEKNRVVGAGTTMVVSYPQMKVARIVTLAGAQFDEWYTLAHAQIELWAEANGCTDMEAYVRKGFVPKLSEIGYKHRYSVVHKSLVKGK